METSEQRITSGKRSRINTFQPLCVGFAIYCCEGVPIRWWNCVTYQVKTFDECENNLEADIEVLNQFFHRWFLQPNPGKTEICVFHLNTHAANKQLDVKCGCDVQRHFNQTCRLSQIYLGVTLDRTLENAAKKVSSRVNLVRKLAGTKWGSNAQTLWMASLTLFYSSVEYCAVCIRLAQ
jgi:hypothetical protein